MVASGCIPEDPTRPCMTYGMTVLQPDYCCSGICATLIFVDNEHFKGICQPQGNLKLMIHLERHIVTLNSWAVQKLDNVHFHVNQGACWKWSWLIHQKMVYPIRQSSSAILDLMSETTQSKPSIRPAPVTALHPTILQ